MNNRRISGDLSLGRIGCDFFVILCLAVPLLIFHEWVQPYKRGFYCDDESIRYPYRPSTVTRQMLIVIGIMVPTLLIMGTELVRSMVWERQCPEEFGIYRYKKYNVHRLIVRFYVFIGYFLLGVCFNQLMVDIAKYTIGRHRPHFMDVCKPSTQIAVRGAGPDGAATQLLIKEYRTNCPPDEHTYITDFECLGENKYLIHESMLSFYSGHAAFSFYAAWYTALYLQARVYKPLASRLVLPAIQFALFGGAAFVAYSRVSNYKHHWSDVLVGTLIGSAIGIINAVVIAEVFHRREVPTKFRSKRRLLGEYTLVPPQAAPNANADGHNSNQLDDEEDDTAPQGRTQQQGQQHQQVDNVRIAMDDEDNGVLRRQQHQRAEHNNMQHMGSTTVAGDDPFYGGHRHQPKIRMVPIQRQQLAPVAATNKEEYILAARRGSGGGASPAGNVISKF